MTKICPNCNSENVDSSDFCQNCGQDLGGTVNTATQTPQSGTMGWWDKQSTGVKAAIGIGGICCIALILIVVIGGMLAPDTNTTTNTTTTTPSTDTSSSDSSVTSATAGEEQAAKMAKSYLDTMAFSRTGLIEQLEYEGFTQQEAEYGVDKIGADWNEQAAKMAKNYLDTMAFSRAGLIEQLEYEGFTRQQAEYGVRAVGL